MSDLKCIVLMAAAAALVALGDARSFDLSEMINKTVCAIDVHYDINKDRIPQRIKIITCAANTDQGCEANEIGLRHCCHHQNKMECAEMRDTVMVFNKKLNVTESIEVSVGCACMIQGSSAAVNALEQRGR